MWRVNALIHHLWTGAKPLFEAAVAKDEIRHLSIAGYNTRGNHCVQLVWGNHCVQLEQQGIRTVFKSETTLRSHLVRPKDTVDPAEQDGVVYRIPCECGKVYIGETGRSMHERIKEHDREIRLARTQTSAVSEHAHKTGHYPLWNEVKFIDRDPHMYTRRVKEAIHIRLHPDNINTDSGIEIPEAWMPTIKKHNRKTVQQRTTEGTTSRQNSEDRNAPITANQRDINGTA